MDTQHGLSTMEALNAKVYGNGSETLVLAHGFGSDQNVWHYLIPYLVCYFKVVVFDLAFSHNVSPSFYDPNKYSSFTGYASDLVSLLDELHVSKTIYVGHSMSAMIGCIAAIDRPDLFQHLVLLSASPRYLNDTGYTGGFERPAIDALLKQMEENFSPWVKGFAPLAIGINNTEAIQEFENSLGSMDPKIAVSVAKTVFLSDVRSILPKMKLPCTIIQSEKDIVVPKVMASHIKRNLGGPARAKILKTQGHFIQLTAYSSLLKTLKRFHVINKVRLC